MWYRKREREKKKIVINFYQLRYIMITGPLMLVVVNTTTNDAQVLVETAVILSLISREEEIQASSDGG